MRDHGDADLAIVFGKPRGKPRGAEDYGSDHEDEPEMGDSDVPADFEAAYDDWKANSNAKTMWDMIQACMAAKG